METHTVSSFLTKKTQFSSLQPISKIKISKNTKKVLPCKIEVMSFYHLFTHTRTIFKHTPRILVNEKIKFALSTRFQLTPYFHKNCENHKKYRKQVIEFVDKKIKFSRNQKVGNLNKYFNGVRHLLTKFLLRSWWWDSHIK